MQLKTARTLAGLSQAELSRRAKVHQATLSRIESGRQINVSHQTVLRICRALDMPASDISEFHAEVAS